MRTLITFLLFIAFFKANCQTLSPRMNQPSTPTPRMNQPGTPEDIVKLFFKKMASADTSGLKAMFTDKAVLQSSSYVSSSSSKISSSSIPDFIGSIARFKPGQLDERVSNIKASVLANIASVSMDYEFYLDGVFSHSGINLFTFLNDGIQWKISSISDTRSKTSKADEDQKAKESVSDFLDKWHLAAARADLKTYFDMMHEESIYLGTDETEVWTKKAYYNYAKPHFDRGKTWDFVKKSRNVYKDNTSNVIWFDEVLDTWMGPCRGSGFLVQEKDGGLKIMQYILSFIVPNDKADQVIKTMGLPVRKK
jgi:hypothetical protein